MYLQNAHPGFFVIFIAWDVKFHWPSLAWRSRFSFTNNWPPPGTKTGWGVWAWWCEISKVADTVRRKLGPDIDICKSWNVDLTGREQWVVSFSLLPYWLLILVRFCYIWKTWVKGQWENGRRRLGTRASIRVCRVRSLGGNMINVSAWVGTPMTHGRWGIAKTEITFCNDLLTVCATCFFLTFISRHCVWAGFWPEPW